MTVPRVVRGRVTLGIGPYRVRFDGEAGGVRFSVPDVFEAFVVEDDAFEPTLVVACTIDESPTATDAPIRQSDEAWDLRDLPDGGEELLYRYGPGNRIPVSRLRLDASLRRGQLAESSMAAPRRVSGVVGSILLEYLVARLTARHGALKLHACTAVVDGRAYVFTGHSGAGKSTIAAIAERCGAWITTDDRTLITVDEAGATAWGTPWHGTLPRKSPVGVPLAAIYLLRQAAENEVRPMPGGRAVHELFVRLINPRATAEEVDRTYAALEELYARVPVAELHFTATPAAFELAVASAREASRAGWLGRRANR